jgi:hypothetical protein
MHIHMTANEIALLSSFLRCATNYLEFGSGGSTVLAARLVKGHIWSVDSSIEWLEKVAQATCELTEKVSRYHVDIGPVGQWGYPLDHSLRSNFPEYSRRIWGDLKADEIDFVLIDGRFRIASFCEANRRVRDDTFIGIHDYQSRTEYHYVEKIARMVATVDDLAIFLPRKSQAECTNELIQKYAFNPL